MIMCYDETKVEIFSIVIKDIFLVQAFVRQLKMKKNDKLQHANHPKHKSNQQKNGFYRRISAFLNDPVIAQI